MDRLTARIMLLVIVTGGAGLASGRAAGRPTLHVPVEVPQLRCEGGICSREGASGATLPEAIETGGAMVPAPTLRPPSPGPGGGDGKDPVYRPTPPSQQTVLDGEGPPPGADPPPVRRTRIGPDRNTGPEPPGERLYHEVFNPAIFPFKRMTVLDAVAEDETLRIRDPQVAPLWPSGSRLADGRDPFYGAVELDLQPGQLVPIPSPAAAVRLLSYDVAPAAQLRFLRDGADNLYVTSGAGGRHRLVYLVDAERRYFAGPLLPPQAPRPRLRDVPAELRPHVPRPVARHGELVLRHIGVRHRDGDDYLEAVERLVGYFRDFRVGDLQGRRGSSYLDLALEQRGACRHRSYAFVITALSAGIPARYVENELHVFVEVFIPVPGRDGRRGYFRRVNLGGAPIEEVVLDAENKVAYKEQGGDPFPQPLAFASAPPQRVRGLPPGAGQAGASPGGGQAGASPGGGQAGGQAERGQGGRPDRVAQAGERQEGPSGTRQGGAGSGQRVQQGAGFGPGAATPPPVASAAEGAPGQMAGTERGAQVPAPASASPERPALLPTSVMIARAAEGKTVYRGGRTVVRGRVQVQGGPAGNLEVVISLDEAGGLELGRALTAADGTFQLEVEVPREATLGQHRLLARVPGDERRGGSTSSGRGR
jgi:transglutaminase-like putative cysteine protease